MNLLVWSSWVKHPVGGQERIALELALQLHRRGHRVVLVGPYDNAPELRARIPGGMPYHHFELHRPIKPHWQAIRLLSRLAADHGVELISGHGNIFAAHQVCRRRGIPLVWTVHGADPQGPRRWADRLKALALRRVLADGLTRVVGVSAATLAALQELYGPLPSSRCRVIHNGVIGEEALRELPLPVAGPPWQLGFIGRLVEVRRPLDLVAVARALREKLEHTIHVFGDGPLRGALAAAVAAHGLQRGFVMHGYWDQGSAGMVRQLQVLVNPVRLEAFGGAMLEAQLGGRPVVAYAVGGNPEIVQHGETGWLCAAADPGALAEGVLAVTGPRFGGMAAAARRRAVERFTLDRMTDQYLELFTGTCASR